MKRVKKTAAVKTYLQDARKPKAFRPLDAQFYHLVGGFEMVLNRGIDLVLNSVRDGDSTAVVVELDGHQGIAKSVEPALKRAMREWNKANKPKVRKKA